MTNGIRLRVGDHVVRIDPGSEVLISHLQPTSRSTVTDVPAALMQAISHPLDFPPLSKAVVDGDLVVITADPDIPRLAEILGALVGSMSDSDVRLTILLGETAQDTLANRLREVVGPEIGVVIHNPDAVDNLGYLAATENADPVYLNRMLLDADLVVPVILARTSSEIDVDPRSGHIHPAFADRISQRRVQGQRLRSQVSENEPSQVAWLLGLQLVIGVVAANGEQVAAIAAGTLEGCICALESPSTEVNEDQLAELVIACIDGNPQQQTWDNLARAVSTARRMVAPGGTVAVCTALLQPPGPSLRRLRSSEPSEKILARLADDPHPDALVAAVLLKSRDEGRVLIQSQLKRDAVEALGFGVIEGDEDLSRLIRQHRRCTIIESAQFAHAIPTP